MLSLQANPNQRLVSSLNPVFVLGFALFLGLIKTTSLWVMPSVLNSWDILLAFMVYLGQRRTLVEGVVLWFLLSHLYSLSSAAPMGIFAIQYLVIFALARLISYAVYANTPLSILGLLALEVLVARFTLPLIASVFGAGWAVFSWRNLHLGSLLSNAVMGFVIFLCLTLLDKLTFKVARTNIEMDGGDL